MNKPQEDIASKFTEVVNGKVLTTNNKTQLEHLTKANDRYNSLVSKGVIKKRGYTLRSIEENHLVNIRFSQ